MILYAYYNNALLHIMIIIPYDERGPEKTIGSVVYVIMYAHKRVYAKNSYAHWIPANDSV